AHLKILYPTPAAYQAFTAKMTTIVGVIALLLVLLVSGNLLRRFGWLFSAKIAPIAIGLSGLIFFVLCQFKEKLGFMETLFGLTPIAAVVVFGAFQNVLSKVVKYSFFDSTKEMAYIPLDYESKVKGKAAIDMVGSRFGKSGSSIIQLILIQVAGTGSILSTTPYLIPVVIFISFYWMRSVGYIGKQLVEKEAAAETALQAVDPVAESDLAKAGE
ncbi:AAA family ATPase, partial [Candidatus Aerophobetes bacterium]